MRSILVTNAKGGCGKTTLATHLAAALAERGHRTVLADVDPQLSALAWLDRRPGHAAEIDGADWTRGKYKAAKSTERLVIDAPAALTADDVRRLLKMADAVVLPVLPSAFDQVAAMTFLSKIETLKPVRKNKKPVAVVANRTRARSRASRALHAFLTNFNHPPMLTLRETVLYTDAADTGLTLFDRTDKAAIEARALWMPLVDYADGLDTL
jgi:chromosome partitioning protein